ncbi:hypothetical protein [uncultured Sphaerotilus sp.]|uniref:hypothetical protein n=1 Tax=uncultured Sphaerotilus sp. TaxID=474984 RepID=UPI0030CA12CE
MGARVRGHDGLVGVAWVLASVLLVPCQAQAAENDTANHPLLTGEWQTAREWRLANPLGPAPAFAPRSRWRSTLDLKGDRRIALGTGSALSVHADAALTVLRDDGDANPVTSGRVNELYASTGSDAWQLSAGRRIIGWDVGQGFRPNDVVQREERRPLLPATPQGRSVVQVEHFGADDATSLVWIDPQGGATDRALALRHYRRFGALDVYGHAHWSAATRGNLGAALAWVASDAVELHASTRWLPALGQHQSLVGGSWTGGPDLTALAEVWQDGLASPSSARRNVYGRLAWQHEGWQVSADALWQPGDGGRVLGAGLRWQGDQWRAEAVWRVLGGPASASLRRTPSRQTGALALTRSF